MYLYVKTTVVITRSKRAHSIKKLKKMNKKYTSYWLLFLASFQNHETMIFIIDIAS